MHPVLAAKEATRIIKVLMKAGQHRGKCKFNMPGGSCSKHFAAYNRRLSRAKRFLAKV